ncbi:hypothetical protein HN51_019987 [Arachis hypogaea]|nr:uncharacterized protein DS421_8g244950 [Arachis hypogaea]
MAQSAHKRRHPSNLPHPITRQHLLLPLSPLHASTLPTGPTRLPLPINNGYHCDQQRATSFQAISFLFRASTMASQMSTMFRSLAFILAVAIFCFAYSTGQDIGSAPSSEPTPGPQAGAAVAVFGSMAMVGASVVMSLLAILKH